MGRYGMFGMYDELIGVAMFMIFGIYAFLVLLPILQNLVESSRRKWYTKSIKRQITANLITTENGQILLDDIENKREFTMYKSLKLFLAFMAVSYIIGGIFSLYTGTNMFEPDYGAKMMNLTYYFPFIYGTIFFLIFIFLAPKNKILREIGTSSFYIGACIIIIGSSIKFNWNFRGELLIFAALSLGLFLIYKYKAIVVSYLYAIIVTIGSILNVIAAEGQERMASHPKYYKDRDYNTTSFFDLYDGFLSYFYWFFALALLVLWHKRLKSTGDLTIKETFFGIFTFAMIMSLCLFVTGQYWILGGALGFILSYLYSSYYYSSANWIIAKPIHIILLLIITYSTVLGYSDVFHLISENIAWSAFPNASPWLGLFALIFLTAFAGAFLWFKFFEDKKPINYFFLSFPLVIILALLIGSIAGSILIVLYLIALGGYYVIMGVKSKNEPYVLAGTFIFLGGVCVKIMEFLKPNTPDRFARYDHNDYQHIISNQMLKTGAIFLILGLIFFITLHLLRKMWTVTGEIKMDTFSDLAKLNALDHIEKPNEKDPSKESQNNKEDQDLQ